MQVNTVKPHESLETRIGLYWLHKLGIASIVFGFAFLMLYSFQAFGPLLKLLTGCAVSAGLIVGGELMAKKEKQKWYGFGLAAGGWALAYFTAYAAYFIATVKFIDSMPLECGLLIGVAGGSLWTAMRANSEIMAILSIVLASSSIIISGPGLFGDISFLIIAASTCILGNRRSWNMLFALGLVSCYVGHACCSKAVFFANQPHESGPAATIFLSLIWLTYTIGIGYSLHVTPKARNFVTMIVCANAAAYGLLLTLCETNTHEVTEILLAASGAAYLAIAKWLSQRDQKQLSTVHSLLGLTLINGAKAIRFSGLTLVTFDIMQVALLATIGIRFNLRGFRWFAVLLSFTVLPMLIWNIGFASTTIVFGLHAFPCAKSGLLATIVFAGLTYIYRHRNSADILNPEVSQRYGAFYYMCANAAAAFTISQIADISSQLLAWSTVAMVNHALALRLKDQLYYAVGVVQLIFTCLYLAGARSQWELVPTALTVCVFYTGYAHTVLTGQNSWDKFSLALKYVYGCAAITLLTFLVYDKAPSAYLSIALGIEAFVLLASGFLMNEKMFRLCGLLLLADLTVKLLFIDMGQHNTIERIISFIAAGFIFLASSYGYAKFTKAFEDKQSDDMQPNEHGQGPQQPEDTQPTDLQLTASSI
jgi:hypothetical protein